MGKEFLQAEQARDSKESLDHADPKEYDRQAYVPVSPNLDCRSKTVEGTATPEISKTRVGRLGFNAFAHSEWLFWHPEIQLRVRATSKLGEDVRIKEFEKNKALA